MEIRDIYNLAGRFLLKAIAYKFEVNAGLHETLTGIKTGARGTARDLSRAVSRDYEGFKMNGLEKTGLERSLYSVSFT